MHEDICLGEWMSDALKRGRCALCGNDANSFATSHIIPRSFFKGIETRTQSAVVSTDGSHTVRRDALYIKDAICHECEHKILAPYDEYATKIYYHGENSRILTAKWNSASQIEVFDSVDRTLLRGFWASLLWRFSISKLPELGDFSIGRVYEERIRHDMLEKGSFDYIDVMSFKATKPCLCAFMLPRKMRLNNGNVTGVNGFAIGTPFMQSYVSMDSRPHPYKTILALTVDGHRLSTSLCKEHNQMCYARLVEESYRDDTDFILQSLRKHSENRSAWDKRRACHS